ncbi:MAG: hypothetical protein K0S76_1112 [Herbinix sp.]|jgi:hypothetical protein|nr:hypothetical protein [Herbinix sp.]
MANKNKPTEQKTVDRYLDLFYMTPSEVSAKDIASLLQDTKGMRIELWEEMNVLELELHNQNTVDFEPVETVFTDPSDAAFIKNRNIKTIYAISLKELDLPAVKPYFEQMIEKFSGFVCADTADFNPVYAGSNTKKS